jgi:hypothetical protein
VALAERCRLGLIDMIIIFYLTLNHAVLAILAIFRQTEYSDAVVDQANKKREKSGKVKPRSLENLL